MEQVTDSGLSLMSFIIRHPSKALTKPNTDTKGRRVLSKQNMELSTELLSASKLSNSVRRDVTQISQKFEAINLLLFKLLSLLECGLQWPTLTRKEEKLHPIKCMRCMHSFNR